MWCACVLLVLAYRATASLRMPGGPGHNACALGGALAVHSIPTGLPVNSGRCNPVYAKEEFQTQPRVTYSDAVRGKTYTLVMLDPDAPNRTMSQYYLHWIKANIKGEDLKTGCLDKATEITTYLGPAPPEGTGLHRYMFILYRQLRGRVTTVVEDPERQFFTLRTWLEGQTRRGVLLYGPVSGVQFRSGFGPSATHLTVTT